MAGARGGELHAVRHAAAAVLAAVSQTAAALLPATVMSAAEQTAARLAAARLATSDLPAAALPAAALPDAGLAAAVGGRLPGPWRAPAAGVRLAGVAARALGMAAETPWTAGRRSPGAKAADEAAGGSAAARHHALRP